MMTIRADSNQIFRLQGQDDFPNVPGRLHPAMSIGSASQRESAVNDWLQACSTIEAIKPMLAEADSKPGEAGIS